MQQEETTEAREVRGERKGSPGVLMQVTTSSKASVHEDGDLLALAAAASLFVACPAALRGAMAPVLSSSLSPRSPPRFFLLASCSSCW